MNQRNIQIILNEHAASGNAARNWPKLEKLLQQKDLVYTLEVTKSQYDAISIAKKYGDQLTSFDNNNLLIVIGGDGTLNQCLTGIKLSKSPNTPIAYIPFGTGNDFATALNISHDFNSLLDLIDGNFDATTIDIGHFYNKSNNKNYYFVNNIGIGLDARIVYSTNHSKSKNLFNKFHLGKLSYLSQLIKSFIKQDTFEITIQNNNKSFIIKDIFFLTITNHPYFGGGVPIVPTATPLDQKLDLLFVKKMNILKFIELFIQIFTNGKHIYSNKVEHFKYNNFSVRTNNSQYLQMDGEDFKKSKLNLEFTLEKSTFYLVKRT